MNTQNNYRDSTSPCKIISKYFAENLVMDDSSKEVNKEKQSTSKKPQTKSEKTRKRPTKRAKGQKDIRTLIKSKKNELVTYAKDFDLICKQSGIDVDPEQLQLAIALSKSLEDHKCTENDIAHTDKSLNCNQRRSKIRTTLQEYGFKTKNAPVKRVKKYRKHYELILVSDAEKQQRIADKYAEFLIKNACISKVNESVSKNCIESYLYNLTTNASYDCIKDDVIFYISDLVPKSVHKCNLKDWSEIPGRPVSPKLEKPNHNFKDIECSQEELNDILSGSIDTAQNIVKHNYTNSLKTKFENSLFTEPVINQEGTIESKSEDSREVLCENKSTEDKLISRAINIISNNSTETMSPPTNRSCSPDLFDDEVTIIMNSSKDNTFVQDGNSEGTNTVNEQNDFMELTNCIGINSNNTNPKHIECFSQGSNRTRSNSNDFMDLTECIPAYSQNKSHNLQSSGSKKNLIKNCNVIEEHKEIEVIDLKQPQDVDEAKKSSGNDEKSLDDTIIMIDENYSNVNTGNYINVMNAASNDSFIIDLVKNQHKSPRVSNTAQPKHNYSIVDLEEIPDINNDSDSNNSYQAGNNITIANPLKEKSKEHSQSLKNIENLDTVDLTQPSNFENRLSPLNANCVQSIATYEIDTEFDIIMNNAVDSKGPNYNKGNNTNETGKDKNEKSKKCDNYEHMDLTQSSNSEDCFQEVVHEVSVNKSLDDTVIHNEHDNSINLVHNELNRNDDIVQSRETSQKTEQKKDNTKNNILPIFDADHDLEFDNLVKNVSNSKPSNLIYGNSANLLHESTIENDSNYQEIDLTQNYDYSRGNLSGPNNLSNQSAIINDDAHSDLEFDNLMENESNSKQGDLSYGKSLNLSHKSTIESDPNIQEIDLTQNYDYSRGNVPGPNNLSNKSGTIDDDHGICDVMNGQGSDIDLTQQSNSPENTSCSLDVIEVPGDLGKRDNISIDYDEVCEKTNNNKDRETTSSLGNTKNFENDINGSKDVSGSSQQSEVFELSDTEFNYSIHQHIQDNESFTLKQTGFDIGGLSVIDNFLNRNSLPRRSDLRCSCTSNFDSNTNENEVESCLPVVSNIENVSSNIYKESKSCEEGKSVKVSTPLKSRSEDNILIAKTPKHDDYVIKTDQVTPMPNYEDMTSPERNEELDKFGIKPLKRKRAIQILTHIYNQTHPLMEVISNDEYSSPSKIRRKNNAESFPTRVIASQIDSILAKESVESSNDVIEVVESNLSQKTSKPRKERISPKGSSSKENILYEETTLVPDIRNIECPEEDWVFQKREKAKVHSCRVPLHIAFHNYVSSRKGLREAILKYEPINIDDIHKGLVAVGYRYNPKDLLKFMDRKCITVKTADNARKNKNP